MTESFEAILKVGGKSNSLGRVDEVIKIVLNDKKQLRELYSCLFSEDAWVRMRAADTIEKICRQNPKWLIPYIDKFQTELITSSQASIQWHLAQIYQQVDLTNDQKSKAISWLRNLLTDTSVDWIVAANVMDSLVQFTKEGFIQKNETIIYLNKQQEHKSKSVVKRANKLLAELSLNNNKD